MTEEPEQWRILDKCLGTMKVIWQGDDTFNQLKKKKKKRRPDLSVTELTVSVKVLLASFCQGENRA